ncbi:pentapeptide repeat-containing protein [Nostoc sp. UHCC 0251]|uniref:pentapeptide repeat-containing protein n=1 Tax=Nostoc sp. UHCC 0251 TaxID=3110240 RepID=UPI002B21C2BA|nr:pentapeptide repeat-containing protein [Nostoc sp. UHCC 0251]MEA5627211.1 pentapeptide repeat-containing protein [Nostoc sp. UHCC 0251]
MALDNSGQNLRGRNFKGRKDLVGANFSYADIRGANFTNANLTGANFSHAKAGLQRGWAIGAALVTALLVLSALSKSVIVALLIAVLVVISVAIVASRYNDLAVALTANLVLAIAGTIALVLALIISAVVTGSLSIFDVVLAGGVPVVLAFFGFIYLAVVGSKGAIISTARARVEAGIMPFSIAIADECLKTAVTNTGGTTFCKADLTDANFTAATLKNTNFEAANLTNTCLFQAKKLDRARVGATYLEKPQVRKLVITGQGQDKNFNGLSLRGVNLQKANLADASFISTDLSEANLQDADLSRAKLKQTQLDGTDLTGATLTGAFIEDWGITNTTKLRGVRCEYVFMRLHTKEYPNPLRKPDNEGDFFKDGDFADFIKPIFDTLDLYHNQGVDPRAVAIAFKNLAENHPEAELEIVAMEKRGDDKILLRAKTAAGSDKSQLSAEYFDDYNQLKALSQSQQLLLVEKDKRIISLENMVDTALKQPKFYTQGDTNMSDISGINIEGSSNVSGIAGGGSLANLGTISGNVSIALNQLPDATDAEKPGIKELLSQLQDAIIQSTYLSEEDKAEALEQVNTLAAAGKNPQESTKQKTAKTAITMLKGIVERDIYRLTCCCFSGGSG